MSFEIKRASMSAVLMQVILYRRQRGEGTNGDFARQPELTWVDLSIDDVILDDSTKQPLLYVPTCGRVRVFNACE